MASASDLLGLISLVLTSTAPCPPDTDVVAAVSQSDRTYLVFIDDDSPLLKRAPSMDDRVDGWPIVSTTTIAVAAEQFANGTVVCGSTVTVAARDLVRPASGRSIFEPAPLPTIAPRRGVIDAGDETTQAFAAAHDLATFKTSADTVVPSRVRFGPHAIDGGVTLGATIENDALGITRVVSGPVVRLSDTATATPPTAKPIVDGARARAILDDRRNHLVVGQRIHGHVDGLGVIDVPVVAAVDPLHEVGPWHERFLLAHGVALAVPAIGFAISRARRPRCYVDCGNPILSIDSQYFDGFITRSDADIDAAGDRLLALSIASAGVAALTTLIPTARRGTLSRYEIIEDLVIVLEGTLVSAPFLVETFAARRTPLSLRRFSSPRETITPPLLAPRANAVGAAWGATTTLLIVEDAAWGWVLASTLAMAGLSAAVSWAEVDAGRVFPSDVIVSAVSGFLNGGGTVLWHRMFWKGWPGSERGDLPLLIHGVQVRSTPQGGTVLSAGASF